MPCSKFNLTPTEFKAGRRALGLSASAAGAAMGVEGRTIRNWEADRSARGVPGPARVVMEGWLASLTGGRGPEWLMCSDAESTAPDTEGEWIIHARWPKFIAQVFAEPGEIGEDIGDIVWIDPMPPIEEQRRLLERALAAVEAFTLSSADALDDAGIE